jgi:hypothetical protein
VLTGRRIVLGVTGGIDTRTPVSPCITPSTNAASWVVPAISDRVNTIISSAGSASEAIIISRLDPIPPKLVPTSSPASARKNRALPSSATSAIISAAQLKGRPFANVGISPAATQVAAKIR